MNTTYLIGKAKELNGCSDGISQLKACTTVDDLIRCYFDRIDYCLANDFPSNKYLSKYEKELKEAGVYIDSKVNLKNDKKIVLLGNSECSLILNDWTVCRVYVKHTSKIQVKASGNSIVIIDALDNSFVEIEQTENARVYVNLYANAKCEIKNGDAIVTNKDRFTYEL